MKIHILGLRESEHGQVSVLEFIPTVPTYAIRIWSDFQPPVERERNSLQQSPLFRRIQEYTFDDIELDYPNQDVSIKGTLFTSSIAERVIKDFEKGHTGCEALLVHCLKGRNRSPAVGIALTEIFKLDHDIDVLKRAYPGTNRYVYQIFISKARALGYKF